MQEQAQVQLQERAQAQEQVLVQAPALEQAPPLLQVRKLAVALDSGLRPEIPVLAVMFADIS